MNPPEFESTAPTQAQIQDTLDQIYDVIDKVGQNLEKTFHSQEDRFLEEYRKQMYSAQKNLREYTKTHSQAELTKKIEEKERSLRLEREKALSATVQSSNRVKELKKNSANLKHALTTLGDEIAFIDDQMVLSEEKNRRLNEEAKLLKLEILKYQPDFEFWEEDPQSEAPRESVSNRPNRKSPYSNYLTSSVEMNAKKAKILSPKSMNKKFFAKEAGYRSADELYDAKEVERMTKIYNNEQRNYEKLTRISNDPGFRKGKFEEIFEECVIKTLEKHAAKGSEQSSHQASGMYHTTEGNQTHGEEEISQADTNMNVEKMLKLSETRLTPLERKMMIEEFLSTNDVKSFLYKKFTEDNTRKTKPLY